jgi:hypothetical protein
MTKSKLLSKVKKLFNCDEVRILRPTYTIFVLVGNWKRSEGEWSKNGEPFDFDFLKEEIVGRGRTYAKCWKDCKLYKKLCNTKGFVPMSELIKQIMEN